MAFVASAGAVFTGFTASPHAFNIDAGSNADRCIVVAVSAFSSLTNQITGVTYGGVALSSAGTRISLGSDDWWELWYLVGSSVPTGTNSVSIAFSGDISNESSQALTFDGVSAFGNYSGFGIGGGTTAPTITVTTVAGDTAVGIFSNDSTTQVGTEGSGVTELYDAQPSSPGPGAALVRFWAGSKVATTTSTVVDFTTAGTSFVARFGFSLTPAAGGGGSTPKGPFGLALNGPFGRVFG